MASKKIFIVRASGSTGGAWYYSKEVAIAQAQQSVTATGQSTEVLNASTGKLIKTLEATEREFVGNY